MLYGVPTAMRYWEAFVSYGSHAGATREAYIDEHTRDCGATERAWDGIPECPSWTECQTTYAHLQAGKCKGTFRKVKDIKDYWDKLHEQQMRKIALFLCAEDHSAKELAMVQAERLNVTTGYAQEGSLWTVTPDGQKSTPASIFVSFDALPNMAKMMDGIPFGVIVLLDECVTRIHSEAVVDLVKRTMLWLGWHYQTPCLVEDGSMPKLAELLLQQQAVERAATL